MADQFPSVAPTPVPPDPNTSSTEPLISVGTITAAATAVIALLVTVGLPISGGQQAAILTAIGVLAPVVVAVWGRRRVYAPATVARLLAAARR